MNQTIPIYRLGLLMLLALMTGSMSFAQSPSDPLTLQECIQYGLNNNASVISTRLDVDYSSERKDEVRAAYLPQVTGTVSVIDNLKLQTSILPGEIIGQPGTQVAVQFGTQYNVVAGANATQVLYDQSLLNTLKTTQQSMKISEIGVRKTEEQLIYDIATAYYSAQILVTQKTLVESNLVQVDTLLQVAQIQFENGFAKPLDIDRLQVRQTNLRTDLATNEMNYQQQLMLLKYYMGMSLDATIELPVMTGEEALSLLNIETMNNVDMELVRAQKELYSLNLKQVRAGYLPTLSMSFYSAVQIQQNDLRIFSKDANWFPNVYLGVNLNIPIFDGLEKNSRANQSRIQIRQTELDEQYLDESLKTQRTNALNNLTINRAAFENQRLNIRLARSVYETTQVQYVGGIASMTDIINAEASMRESQTNFLRALVQVKLSELDLLKITGNITSLK